MKNLVEVNYQQTEKAPQLIIWGCELQARAFESVIVSICFLKSPSCIR